MSKIPSFKPADSKKIRNYPLIGTIKIKAFAHLIFLKEGSPTGCFWADSL